MRKLGLAAGLLILASPALALPDQPGLAQWNKYVPAGWKVITSAQGKLSAKSAGDAVLIIEKNDASLFTANERLGPEKLNLNPRRLIFLTKTPKGYRQTSVSNGFIPSENDAESSCLADPLEEGGIDIAKGVFSVTLNYWLSCGSYGVTKRVFKFRQENGQYRLIGADNLSYSRASGEGSQVSINYLTARKKTTTGIEVIKSDGNGELPYQQKIAWSRIGPQLYYLEKMKHSDCDDYENAPSWCSQ